MRAALVAILLCGGCASAMKGMAPPGADELGLAGAWIGLDDSGAHWWRLDLERGRVGRAGITIDDAVAGYRIAQWTADAQGTVTVNLARDGKATALDRMPASMRLTGQSDATRLRLMHEKTEIVFWREDRLIAAHKRLKTGMAPRE